LGQKRFTTEDTESTEKEGKNKRKTVSGSLIFLFYRKLCALCGSKKIAPDLECAARGVKTRAIMQAMCISPPRK
jgi:hypothetical protein